MNYCSNSLANETFAYTPLWNHSEILWNTYSYGMLWKHKFRGMLAHDTTGKVRKELIEFLINKFYRRGDGEKFKAKLGKLKESCGEPSWYGQKTVWRHQIHENCEIISRKKKLQKYDSFWSWSKLPPSLWSVRAHVFRLCEMGAILAIMNKNKYFQYW